MCRIHIGPKLSRSRLKDEMWLCTKDSETVIGSSCVYGQLHCAGDDDDDDGLCDADAVDASSAVDEAYVDHESSMPRSAMNGKSV